MTNRIVFEIEVDRASNITVEYVESHIATGIRSAMAKLIEQGRVNGIHVKSQVFPVNEFDL